jgi:hypothetical protein
VVGVFGGPSFPFVSGNRISMIADASAGGTGCLFCGTLYFRRWPEFELIFL